MTTLDWQGLGVPGSCHISRLRYDAGKRFGLHDHSDFAELCWVERGRVRHDTDRSTRLLAAGDCLLVRPEHRHGLRGLPEGGTLVNIAVPAAVLADFEARYGGADWPWATVSEPACLRLGPSALARCGARLAELPVVPSPLQRDALLLTVLEGLQQSRSERWAGAPDWLAEGLDALAAGPDLADGVPALAARCKRSREHVARTVRAHLGRRAVDVVNELRLERAARELSRGDAAVASVAAALGFANRTHFHRLFRDRYGSTPAAWRRAARLPVAG